MPVTSYFHKTAVELDVERAKPEPDLFLACAERLGFAREGLLREAEWVNDRWVDLMIWGMLEQEWRKH